MNREVSGDRWPGFVVSFVGEMGGEREMCFPDRDLIYVARSDGGGRGDCWCLGMLWDWVK